MLFMVPYSFSPESLVEIEKRFKDTGGLPPDGVKMLGRWHLPGGHGGYLLAETDDSLAIGKWLREWRELISFDIKLVVVDEEIAKIIP